ncbi:MAG: hypothetical protein JWR70_412, partial [Modestobacter sp.]|nr:hypothetical protein [Modestobacter sp.]
RRAAGRADGRPSRRPRRPVLRAGRRLGTAVITGVLAVLPLVCAPHPAVAAPADLGASPVNVGASPDADRPVHIAVDRLEPRTLTPGSTIVLSGTLVNDSDVTFTDLAVRLQRGDPLATRQELAADLAAPGDATAATAPFLPVPGELHPGASLPFSYTATTDDLRLAAEGVYPALVNVNGTRAGGTAERVGELSTYLVAQPTAPVSRTTVAWLWPFTDRPHRDAGGAFTDDDLAAEVAPDGRLDRALTVLEHLPAAPGTTSGPGSAVPVTLAVDPALLEEIATMAAGRYTVHGQEGSGTARAAEFLTRMRKVAAVHTVVALPYADVDADALVSAGQAAVVTRSLPGTPKGTARQPVGSDGTATATPAAPDTGAGSTGGGGDHETSAGAALVHEVLDVHPRTDVAWPAGGTVRADTLDVLAAGGTSTVVLGEGALTGGTRAVGTVRGTVATARADLTTSGGGPITALVADTALGEAVAAATTGGAAPRIAEQRYLAELGVLTTQLGSDRPDAVQTVLVVPPRDVAANPESAAAMLGDTMTQPWLRAASLSDLAAGPGTDAGTLTGGVGTDGGLPRDGLTRIAATVAVRDDFAAAVASDPDVALAGYDAAIARASSAAWRGDPAGFAAATADVHSTVDDLRDKVTLLAPANGTYSLASSDAPLVLTVQNDLPFPVDVRLDLRTRGNVGLATDDTGVTIVKPQSRTTVQVPAHVRQSGSFTVTAALTTPAGGALGEPVQMQVKSTAYGAVTLVITLGAAALLGLLFVRRLVRFLLNRRRGTPPVEGATTDPLSVPPVRSPV